MPVAVTTPVRALYVHVPLCRTRCGYCDFYSQVFDPALPTPLVAALMTEFRLLADRYQPVLDTIFIGGGTPTMLPGPQLRDLLLGLVPHTANRAELEWTVEANPATVNAELADLLVEAGVNRLSIGAQSFDADELRVLDRTHEVPQVAETVARARAAGIRNISMDLIFGIPGQTLASWCRSLNCALELAPDHLSCYGLTYEPGTPLQARLLAGAVAPVAEELEAEMYELAMDVLPAAGLMQYELSNYARPHAACRHNLRYWHNEPCLAIGPSAAGLIDGVRYKNVADTAAYIQALQAGESAWAEHERLTTEQRACETAMLQLRLTSGIPRAVFAERFGDDPRTLFSAAVEKHVARGWLEVTERAVRLTRPGRLVANQVMMDFL